MSNVDKRLEELKKLLEPTFPHPADEEILPKQLKIIDDFYVALIKEECDKTTESLRVRHAAEMSNLDQEIMTLKAKTKAVLLKIKEEMRMHTVPEGRGLITRSYLENTIDFEIKELSDEVEK